MIDRERGGSKWAFDQETVGKVDMPELNVTHDPVSMSHS
jgi:hypothetical protein